MVLDEYDAVVGGDQVATVASLSVNHHQTLLFRKGLLPLNHMDINTTNAQFLIYRRGGGLYGSAGT